MPPPMCPCAGPKGSSLNPLRQVLDFVDEEVPCVSYEQVHMLPCLLTRHSTEPRWAAALVSPDLTRSARCCHI